MLLHETTIRRRIEYITIYILYCEIGGISRLLRATLVWRQVTVKLSIGSTFIVGGGLETLFFFLQSGSWIAPLFLRRVRERCDSPKNRNFTGMVAGRSGAKWGFCFVSAD